MSRDPVQHSTPGGGHGLLPHELPCSLCDSRARPFVTVDAVAYWRCDTCGLTLMHPSHHLSHHAEKAQYDQHDNRIDDPGYRRFLSKTVDPLLERLAPGASVLDFGCGPGPALAAMFDEAGHPTAVYDPYYAPDTVPLSTQYNAVACTEVVEHFASPREGFNQLASLLKPGGWLGVMTCLQNDDAAFADWHYRRDPTHVCFYSAKTLEWIAQHYRWTLVRPHKDVALFHRPVDATSATVRP